MAFDYSLFWYFLMGLLLANGLPHFVFGAAGKVFKSPFGQRSSPRTNVLWGLSNFIAATAITLTLDDSTALFALLAGFWLIVLMFGFGIKRFLSEP